MKTPKYERIKQDLKLQIISGKFKINEKFYTQAELMKFYKVSSITVIRALNELVDEGYLVRFPGKGSFISHAKKRKLVEFSDLAACSERKNNVTVLAIEKENEKSYLKKLKLGKEDFYYRIERVHLTNGKPYLYQKAYIPAQYMNPYYKNLRDYDSIPKQFHLDYNIHMGDQNFQETNEIVYPTPQKIARILKMQAKEPSVIQKKTTTMSLNNKPLEYIKTYKKWDYYKVKFSLRNHQRDL